MKSDDLLYELMEEINDTEAIMIEKDLEEVDEILIKRQENMVLEKIHAEMSDVQKRPGRKLKKRKLVALVAVAVMMLSMMAFARANDWDIEFVNAVGLNGAMEQLDGGYVKIGKSVENSGITITAVQSIGDRNHQWIQLDTDVPWDVSEDGYYEFEELELKFCDFLDDMGGYAASWYSYNNNGNVSFMVQADAENINRGKISLELGALYKHESEEYDDRTLICDGKWELKWKNYYAANTITKHPMVKIDNMLIHTIVVSPISIRVEATTKDTSEEKVNLAVEKITLDDGTEIVCEPITGGFSATPAGMFSHDETFYKENMCINVDRIKSLTIKDVVINIK